jgi:hypothetical protein
MEAEALGGNSGSPAFFYFPSGRRGPAFVRVEGFETKRLFLAGVVSGYFQDWSEVKVTETTGVPYTYRHMGVTGIVPAYYLHEILFSEDEKKFRETVYTAHFPNGY